MAGLDGSLPYYVQGARRRTAKEANGSLGDKREVSSPDASCNNKRKEPNFSSESRRRYKRHASGYSLSTLFLLQCIGLVAVLGCAWVCFHSTSVMKSKSLSPSFRTISSTEQHEQHVHAIPNILIFTHRYNLLSESSSNLESQTKLEKDEQRELLVLQRNVRHSIDLHPKAQVRFLVDEDCLESIRAVMGNNTPLVHYFLQEKVGMFKADLCRGAALWETGGLYFDVDLGVRLNLWTVLNTTTTFATVRVHAQSQHKGAFFQAFIGATPQHPVLLRYVELFLDYYEGRLPNVKGPLGVLLLRRALEEILNEENTQRGQSSVADTTEIWQEVLYLPELENNVLKDIPPPIWGKRRACKFIVISSPHLPVTVPFYSRIAGSRMCPILNETKTVGD